MAALAALDALSPGEVAARLAASPASRAALIRAGAEAGLDEAQAVWGQMLLDGADVPRDAAAALGWFVRAAAQGHLMALNMVGRCYDLGQGTPVDKHRAAACFRVAAERGLPDAMYNWATALTLGEGVAEDRAAAFAWFGRAAAAGYAKARNHLGSFHEDGWVVPQDMARAAELYAEAAAGGDFRGAFNHARMLAQAGRIDEAVVWLRRAGEWGNAAFNAKALAWLATAGPVALRVPGAAARQAGAAMDRRGRC